ncbi:MAG: sodium:solute symporter family transporter, partial [Cobetia marina]
SALNATTTLFSTGIYKAHLRRDASDEEVVKVSKGFGWVLAIASMTLAPLLAGQESLFGYLQKMNAIYFIPIFAVVLMGLLTRRVPTIAANLALLIGCSVIGVVYFVPAFSGVLDVIHEFHFVGLVFVLLIAMMLIIGKLAPRDEPWIQQDVGAIDMTPWKGAKVCALLLVVLVIAIYLAFI